MKTDYPREPQPDFTIGAEQTENGPLPVVIVLNETHNVSALVQIAREHKAVDCPPGSECDKFRVAFLNGVLPMSKTFLCSERQLELIMREK